MAVKLVVRSRADAAASPAEVTYAFSQSRVVIGRSAGADVRLPHLSVSEHHATLEQSGAGVTICDEGTTNGTFVHGVPLVAKRPRMLNEGDIIAIGEFQLQFYASPVLTQHTTPERTASLARKLLCDLLGSASPEAAAPTLSVVEGKERGTRLQLSPPPSQIRIGRDAEAELTLDDDDVSRLHLSVERDLDGTVLRDLASKNGIEVNGKRLRERRLRDGDQIRLGATVLLYEDAAERALKNLEGKADMLVTRTQPLLAAVPMQELLAGASMAVPQAPTLPPARRLGAADTLVYVLALLVLALSLLGLFWLFRV